MADEVIILTGIKETVDALKEFDKSAVRRFNKVINTELANAERDAHGIAGGISNGKTDTPMSGWGHTTLPTLREVPVAASDGLPGILAKLLLAFVKLRLKAKFVLITQLALVL